MNENALEGRALQYIIEKVKSDRKYSAIGLPDATIEDIAQQELTRHPKVEVALNNTKAILHNVVAPYLDDVDYPQAKKQVEEAFALGNEEAIRQTALKILEQHESTRERLPYLEQFYEVIRTVCRPLSIIIDLACGLNPLALPFMGMTELVRYYAYDIHQPRVELINQFFKGWGLEPLAEVRDVLVHPPQIQADAAFLFKEAHRMEKRRKGSSRDLIKVISARVVFISLPTRSLDRRRNLSSRMERLVKEIFANLEGDTGREDFAEETLYWKKRKSA